MTRRCATARAVVWSAGVVDAASGSGVGSTTSRAGWRRTPVLVDANGPQDRHPLICPAGPFPAIVEDQSMPANQPLDALAEWQVLEALRWDRTKLAIHVEFDARCLADLAENFGACCLFPDGHPETAVLKVYGNWVREIVFHHACYRRVAACARSQQSDRSNDRSSEPATDGRAQDLSHVAVDVALHLVPPMRPDHDERRGRAGTAVTSSGWGHGRRATTPPPAGPPGH